MGVVWDVDVACGDETSNIDSSSEPLIFPSLAQFHSQCTSDDDDTRLQDIGG